MTKDNKLTLELLVHLEPVGREGWQGKDDDRPLNELGQRQAEKLAEQLGQVDAVFSSPALRCQQSVEPLAKKLGLPVLILPEFRETGGNKAPKGWARGDNDGPDPLGGAQSAGSAAMGLQRIQSELPSGGRAVICSYGDIIPVFLAYMAGTSDAELPARVNKRGSSYTVAIDGTRATIESQDAASDFPT